MGRDPGLRATFPAPARSPWEAVQLRARHQAVETPREEVARPLDADLVAQAGMPPVEVALSLLASLERELWT